MPIPRSDQSSGTKRPPRHHKHVNGGGSGGASKPHKKHHKGGSGLNAGGVFDLETLNPPFDPRMRRIGSPLDLSSQMKRGWIQGAEPDNKRKVNFLFNPPAITAQHAMSTTVPPPTLTAEENSAQNDLGTPSLASIGSSVGVTLLYDRTYEMFSPRRNSDAFASRYGVWADVAAWYTFLGAFDEMPTSWDESIMKNQPLQRMAYLFMGPRMVFYGFVSGISVTYSHWSLNMVPQRCAVDISFEIQPDPGTPFWRKQSSVHVTDGYWGEYTINPDGTVVPGADSPIMDPIDFGFSNDPEPPDPAPDYSLYTAP
jgi:hypothetical protein